MDGVSFHFDVQGLSAVVSRLNKAGALDKHELMEGLGRLGQRQTRHRIEVEKKTPAGRLWLPTKTARDLEEGVHPGRGRAALFANGTHLWRSIDYVAGETEARWGSGWIGARAHHFGAHILPKGPWPLRFHVEGRLFYRGETELPPRPYIGLSLKNEQEMIRVAERFVAKVLQ